MASSSKRQRVYGNDKAMEYLMHDGSDNEEDVINPFSNEENDDSMLGDDSTIPWRTHLQVEAMMSRKTERN